MHFSFTKRSFPAISAVSASSGVDGAATGWLWHIEKVIATRAIRECGANPTGFDSELMNFSFGKDVNICN